MSCAWNAVSDRFRSRNMTVRAAGHEGSGEAVYSMPKALEARAEWLWRSFNQVYRRFKQILTTMSEFGGIRACILWLLLTLLRTARDLSPCVRPLKFPSGADSFRTIFAAHINSLNLPLSICCQFIPIPNSPFREAPCLAKSSCTTPQRCRRRPTRRLRSLHSDLKRPSILPLSLTMLMPCKTKRSRRTLPKTRMRI